MISRRTFAMLFGAAAATADVAACSGNKETSPSSSGNGSSGAFPVTIKHVYGETVIEKRPERVATVNWANQEVPLALGVVPVGMQKVTWGDEDGDGLFPWVQDKLTELGGEPPVLFDETDGIPFESVNDTNPDVILASYSGITQEDYDTLTKIAPTIAYPGVPWGTTMNDMIRLNSQAMGLASEGDALITKLKAEVSAAADKYPNLKGKKVMFTALMNADDDLSKFGFYTTKDTRAGFLLEAGMAAPKVVEEESAKTDAFWYELSSENPEVFDDVDILLAYGPADPAPLLASLKAHPLLSRIPAIAEDRVVFLGQGYLGALANPSPLSIGWGIDQYFAKLAEGLT